MAKYKKQEVHMIDMSGRLKVKIVHEEFTQEDEKEWENEINEMQKKLEERMKRYDEYIKSIFISAHSDSYQPSDKDSDYFINEYSEKFIGRNSDNIKNRLELYRKYLGEQDN